MKLSIWEKNIDKILSEGKARHLLSENKFESVLAQRMRLVNSRVENLEHEFLNLDSSQTTIQEMLRNLSESFHTSLSLFKEEIINKTNTIVNSKILELRNSVNDTVTKINSDKNKEKSFCQERASLNGKITEANKHFEKKIEDMQQTEKEYLKTIELLKCETWQLNEHNKKLEKENQELNGSLKLQREKCDIIQSENQSLIIENITLKKELKICETKTIGTNNQDINNENSILLTESIMELSKTIQGINETKKRHSIHQTEGKLTYKDVLTNTKSIVNTKPLPKTSALTSASKAIYFPSLHTKKQSVGKNVILLGDSMIRSLKPAQIGGKERHCSIKTLRGKRISHIKTAVEQLATTQPGHIVLHAGTNNLPNMEGMHAHSVIEKIMQEYIDVLNTTERKFPMSKIHISCILYRHDDLSFNNHIIDKINIRLFEHAKFKGYGMIDNSNIDQNMDHFCPDGLHLNNDGARGLANNIRNNLV